MHMWAFLVTTLMNHALPADDGIGEKPPQDDWGIWNAVQQHHNMPIRPVPPAQIINCDASTIGIRCNPDGANESAISIVVEEDDMSGYVRSYWLPGADLPQPGHLPHEAVAAQVRAARRASSVAQARPEQCHTGPFGRSQAGRMPGHVKAM